MLTLALCLLALFAVWTLLVAFVDVQTIGPQDSRVGLATLNRFVHGCVGVCMPLYTVTDWLGIVPLATALGFALLGLAQWIGRESLRRVDRSLLVLGVFYLAVIAAFGAFELAAVNYRPILIEGRLEVSYPSSTTLLAACVMPTAGMQLRARIKKRFFRRAVLIAVTVFTAFMVIGRLLSGVHWISDIIGGALLAAALVMLYAAFER